MASSHAEQLSNLPAPHSSHLVTPRCLGWMMEVYGARCKNSMLLTGRLNIGEGAEQDAGISK